MFDLLVKNGNVVLPNRGVVKADIGVSEGMISQIGRDLGGAERAEKITDAREKYVFPGIIDSHFHVGIYRPLADDALSESSSAVAGGVTTILSYFRSGRNYLNVSEPYSTLLRKVLQLSSGNFYTDYGYHLAPITSIHVQEIPTLVRDHGISTFKYYMFYRGLILKGEFRKGDVEKEYLLSDEPYDLGHLYKMMKTISETKNTVGEVRLSIHAEDAELIRVSMEKVREQSTSNSQNPLEAYNNARPPESERFALIQAAELAHQTNCPINILHVSSGIALNTIRELRVAYPNLDIMVETTVHHLMLNDKFKPSVFGKVNPPIRTTADSDTLWTGIASGQVDTVASDHACLTSEQKGKDIWTAEPGFGGTELLLSLLITEGHLRRRIPLEQIAALVTLNPAKFHGLYPRKGDIAIGFDADLVICDLTKNDTVDHKKLHSAQDFSPFDGLELLASVDTTILRGNIVYDQGEVIGKPSGHFLKRPISFFGESPARA